MLINWIRAFLTERSQAVRIGNSLSDWKSPRVGIPQGTKLGVILFAVMTNNLLREWHLRIKFVEGTTALEILPRNGISLLNVAVNDIHKSSIEHNMKLNPKKCKEMFINFMLNDNFTTRPIVLRSLFKFSVLCIEKKLLEKTLKLEKIIAVRTRGPYGKIRTAGTRAISQSDSRI